MDKYLVISTETIYADKPFSSECEVSQNVFVCLTEDEAKTYAETDHDYDFGRGVLSKIETLIIKIADEDVGFIKNIDLGTYGHSE